MDIDIKVESRNVQPSESTVENGKMMDNGQKCITRSHPGTGTKSIIGQNF